MAPTMREVAKTCSPNHRCKLAVQREEENLIYYQMVMMMELTSEAYMDESPVRVLLDYPLKIWSYM